MPGNPKLQILYTENMFIDFTWLNVQAKSPTWTILYQFKWDVALCKLPKQHKGLSVLASTTGLILGLRPANERQGYSVTTSLIGWVQA